MLFITQPRVGNAHNEILALQMVARGFDWEVLPAPGGWRLDDEIIASNQEGLPYGSQIFCEVISQQMNWKLKANTFDWLTTVSKKHLRRQIDFMTLGEARKITEEGISLALPILFKGTFNLNFLRKSLSCLSLLPLIWPSIPPITRLFILMLYFP